MPDDLYQRESTYRTGLGLGLGPEPEIEGVEIERAPIASAEIEIDEDGGVLIFSPAVHGSKEEIDATPASFHDNLADRMSDSDLTQLAADINEGVRADIMSRSGFIENITTGLQLLGLEIKAPEAVRAGKGAVSTVTHPVLLEALIKFQSQARGELYPSDGPVKVKTRGAATGVVDDLAQALQDDMNWYLTSGAPEYVPDGDRGLIGLGYSGNLFRKVYMHPLWRRPVVDSIGIADFIVSEETVCLDTAVRITHRNTDMARSMLRRMQVFGGWRDVHIPTGVSSDGQFKDEVKNIMGLSASSIRPQDLPVTIDETITDLDLSEYGLRERGVPGGLPISYAVTMDPDSMMILSINRRWKYGDKEYRRVHPYVHYQMIPAFGFLALGYVHLLGNQSQMLTAMWRLMCDAGMFANFPGGVRAKGARVNDNNITPSPGEWPEIDIGSFDDIRKAMMAMPYKDVSANMIKLTEVITGDAQRLAGAVEMMVGEGKTNVPVGTMLAMVEQATQTMAVVHKRLHLAQARELELLKECFAENPEALWRLNPDPKRKWRTAEEFENINLIPASDPNVPAQIHRIMIAQAMVTMAGQNPDIYDRRATHIRAWKMIGVSDPDQIMLEAPATGGDGGAAAEAAMKKMELQSKADDRAARTEESKRKAAAELVDAQKDAQKLQADMVDREAERASKERVAEMRAATDVMKLGLAERELEQGAEEAELDYEASMAKLKAEKAAAKSEKKADDA